MKHPSSRRRATHGITSRIGVGFAFFILAAQVYAQSTGSANEPPSVPKAELTAAQLQQYVPGLKEGEARRLAATGEILSDYSDAISTRLAPPFAGRDEMVNDLKQTDASVGLELLFTARLPGGFRQRPDFWLTVYNVMRSVSTLKGIEYFSADRNEMRTFYYDAYAIASPDSRNTPIPDPTVTSIPADSHIFTFHRDSSFGNYVMDVHYQVGPTVSNPDYIRMSLTNVTTMHYTVIPVAQPRHLQIDLIVVPKGDSLLFYSNFIANAPSIFGLRDKIDVSFSNRIKALFTWFTSELQTAAAAH